MPRFQNKQTPALAFPVINRKHRKCHGPGSSATTSDVGCPCSRGETDGPRLEGSSVASTYMHSLIFIPRSHRGRHWDPRDLRRRGSAGYPELWTIDSRRVRQATCPAQYLVTVPVCRGGWKHEHLHLTKQDHVPESATSVHDPTGVYMRVRGHGGDEVALWSGQKRHKYQHRERAL